MYSEALLLLLPLAAALAAADPQGEGLGYPPPPPEVLSTTKSGVLPVLPTSSAAFTGVAINEGAIIYDGKPNPTFMPVNGPATTQVGLPAATYQAMLPPTNYDNGFDSTVTGSITISSSPNAPGVMVMVDFTGLPSEEMYGPFVYHVHALPVPASGDCTATLGHLDPTNRGEYYPCDPSAPQTCQVGDLSGKHGNITMSTLSTSYPDAFLSTDPSSPSFFGDKSVVIHSSNATRITCANFVMVGMGGNGTSGGAAPSGTGVMPAGPSYSVPVQMGGAGVIGFGGLAVAAAVAAFVL